MAEITSEDLVIGKCFEAKKPSKVGFPPLINDRQVIWIDSARDVVQYDSPSIGFGRKYRSVSMESFLKWAGRDVTGLMPGGEWRTAAVK